MNTDRQGRELFIVDNSVSGWTGLRYLEEWCSLAKSFDIATGFFEIGALLALDGKWQGLDKIRILMGSEMTSRTRKVLLESVKADITRALDESIEKQKTPEPFLERVPAILDALRTRKIECRVYEFGHLAIQQHQSNRLACRRMTSASAAQTKSPIDVMNIARSML